MRTYISVIRESRNRKFVDVFDLSDLTDMRRFTKAMERAAKSGAKFEIIAVSNRRD